MLLVDDDETETLEWQEYGAASTENDVIGIGGELFLPNFHTLSIRILTMVDTQTTTEDALQAFHHLDGKGNLGQEIKHLLLFVECLLYEVNVDFRLAAGGNTVKQRDILLEERKLYLVEGVLLDGTEGFDVLGMRLATMVQASHFLLIGFKQSTFNKGRDGSKRMALVQEFVAGNTQLIVYS